MDADYTGRFTTNIVVRNIGFEFSAPLESTSGHDINELPYFEHGINFMAPQTDLPAVWDSYQNVVENLKDLRDKGTRVLDDRAGGTAGSRRINIADAARVRLANDNFDSAKALFGAATSINGINVAARREAFEPDHLPLSASLGENSVWYSWTAPLSGPMTIDTCTSGFDTALAAYTGSDIGSLSQVASNDDDCNAPNHRGSKIAFDAVAGTEYRIAVADAGGDCMEDTFTLKVIDRTPPSVTGTDPANEATGVLRGANVRATFSEAMKTSSITANTFELRRAGSTTNVAAVVSYDLATMTATLNPNINLKTGATCLATLTTGATDLAGNQLDQDPNTAGNQSKSWKFQMKR